MVVSMKILKDGDKPIHEQLEELILDRIQKGELKPNDQIESENSVARAYGISRSTVRSVYDRLVLKKILSRRAGKGTFVAFPVMSTDFSLLVGFSRTMKSQGINLTTKLLSRKVVEGRSDVGEKLNLEDNDRIIEIRRIRYIRQTPFVFHVAYLPLIGCQPALEADLENISLTAYIEDVLEYDIRKAKQFISSRSAGAEEAELLKVSNGTPVLIVKGISYQRNDIPIRYSVSTFRSDIVELQATSEKPLRNL